MITNVDGVKGLNYLSLHLGQVFNESNYIRFGMELPIYFNKSGASLLELLFLVGYEYYFNGFTQNSFNIQTSLDYRVIEDLNLKRLGFSLGIGYSFKFPAGNMRIFGNYSYIVKSSNFVSLGLPFARY